jgi:uncharacterized protein YsxB (DUF464 family)
MVKIFFSRDGLNRYCGFSCTGHAKYREQGYDIVCAGISTLTQTTIIALEKLLEISVKIKANKKPVCFIANGPIIR